MSYYTICPECGATLDPGEKCDCNHDDLKDEDRTKSSKEDHHAQ